MEGKMAAERWQSVTSIFLVGVGVGAAVGVLLAPRSGEQTRRRIANAVNDGVDEIVEQGGRIGRRAQKTVESAKAQIRDAAEAGEKAFREVKSAVS
jgi:gas vesicle protein